MAKMQSRTIHSYIHSAAADRYHTIVIPRALQSRKSPLLSSPDTSALQPVQAPKYRMESMRGRGRLEGCGILSSLHLGTHAMNRGKSLRLMRQDPCTDHSEEKDSSIPHVPSSLFP